MPDPDRSQSDQDVPAHRARIKPVRAPHDRPHGAPGANSKPAAGKQSAASPSDASKPQMPGTAPDNGGRQPPAEPRQIDPELGLGPPPVEPAQPENGTGEPPRRERIVSAPRKSGPRVQPD